MRLAALLLVALLAGCQAPAATTPPPGQETPPRVLVWDGATPPYAYAPGIEATPPAWFAFDVEPGVGYVNASLDPRDASGGALEVGVYDERGRMACAVLAPPSGDGCTAAVPPNLTGRVTYEAFVTRAPSDLKPGAAADAVPFRLRVALHGAPPLADVPAPASPLRFRLQPLDAQTFEPTLGLDAKGAIFVVAFTKTLRSRDDGRTWEDATPPGTPPTTFDPMLYVDPWTGRVLVDQLTVACSALSWSDDEGASWTTSPIACGLPVDDHPKLAVGDATLPLPVFDGTIYYQHSGLADLVGAPTGVWVSRSVDGGLTWTPSLAMSRATGTQDLIGGPLAADRAGNVYVPAYLSHPGVLEDGHFAVSVSNDHGASFTPRVVAEARRIEDVDPGLAIDAAGNVFGEFLDADGVHVVASTDHGLTWTAPKTVPTPGLRSFVMGDVVAGDAGRVAVAFLATPDSARGPHQADGWARWYLYAAQTQDALASDSAWTVALVTPEPVQVGTICELYVICPMNDRNLGDFLDVQAGPDGRAYVAYVRDCPAGCATGPDSRESQGYVAVQSEGPRLFAERAPWAKV